MQHFFEQSGLLVVEYKCFRDRCCTRLNWTETQFYNRSVGKTPISEAERIAMGYILTDIRNEIRSGELNVTKYNQV